MKLCILFTNFGPYHRARLHAAEQKGASRGWKVEGIQLAEREQDYSWRPAFPSEPGAPAYTVLEPKRLLESASGWETSRRLLALLNKVRPDALAIAGYARLPMLAGLAWCKWNRRPAILMTESKEDDTARSFWRESLKRVLVQLFDAALVSGRPQKRYALKLGMRLEQIFTGYAAVGSYAPQAGAEISSQQANKRPVATPYFLSVARFVEKKNLPILLEAYSLYRKKYSALRNANSTLLVRSDKTIDQTIAIDQPRADADSSQSDNSLPWGLVICGDGPLRGALEQQCKRLALNGIQMPGFLQEEELRPWYTHASCFIHPSYQEQWGLVVNEAMTAGLPVLVSRASGCCEDLVVEGVTGFGFDPCNPQELADRMIEISSGRIDCSKMGEAARKHIELFMPERFGEGIFAALDAALALRKGNR